MTITAGKQASRRRKSAGNEVDLSRVNPPTYVGGSPIDKITKYRLLFSTCTSRVST
ncbi:MAG: hypothetical protein ACRCUY_01510 [Thermoguttaceae bacterium]